MYQGISIGHWPHDADRLVTSETVQEQSFSNRFFAMCPSTCVLPEWIARPCFAYDRMSFGQRRIALVSPKIPNRQSFSPMSLIAVSTFATHSFCPGCSTPRDFSMQHEDIRARFVVLPRFLGFFIGTPFQTAKRSPGTTWRGSRGVWPFA